MTEQYKLIFSVAFLPAFLFFLEFSFYIILPPYFFNFYHLHLAISFSGKDLVIKTMTDRAVGATAGDAFVFATTGLLDFVGSFFEANAIVSLSATFIRGQLPLKAFMLSADLEKMKLFCSKIANHYLPAVKKQQIYYSWVVSIINDDFRKLR